MGFERHGTFERAEEWKAARLGEVEFTDMARALKALAAEKGIEAAPVIDCLAEGGLGPALALLAGIAGPDAAACYHRRRAAGLGD